MVIDQGLIGRIGKLIVDIRVLQSREALEEEDIPHTVKRLLRWEEFDPL